VVLASTLTELVVKLTPQFVEPSVVVIGCTGPDGAGMILVCDLVALVGIRAVSHTMSRGHELSVLDDHLATMLITMPLSANTRVFCKIKDVHGYIVAGDLPMSRIDELKCWPGYRRVRGKVPGSKGSCKRMGESIYDRIGNLIKEDLRKWVKERWVDIGAPKKGGGFKPCGRSKGEKRKGYPKCVPAAKAARMSKGQRKSAVRRKRAAGNPGGKPTMVSTFKKK
jgi:hypothetical protein